ncbi:Retrotransposable element Tf2 [Senna tora]|uniref:Retrotransposable element Tf2 n=1 Tax=Senna tora TaxID=362788 RepID=A0A834X729_9FABA|nr:Retrotransposable element Tf2 [Senna tora]
MSVNSVCALLSRTRRRRRLYSALSHAASTASLLGSLARGVDGVSARLSRTESLARGVDGVSVCSRTRRSHSRRRLALLSRTRIALFCSRQKSIREEVIKELRQQYQEERYAFAQNAYELFKTRINFLKGTRLLHFFANFGVTWILTWDYTFYSKLPSPYPNYLARDFNIKWWSAYDPTLLSTYKLDSWFKEHPQQLKNIVQDQSTSQFLTSKSKIMAELAAAGSEEEFQEKLRALSEAGHSDESNSESTTRYTALNEDDCYGVIMKAQVPSSKVATFSNISHHDQEYSKVIMKAQVSSSKAARRQHMTQGHHEVCTLYFIKTCIKVSKLNSISELYSGPPNGIRALEVGRDIELYFGPPNGIRALEVGRDIVSKNT